MENTKMKLSIIVPVYNVVDYIAKCLASLLAQDLPQNEYEIIVVNDGSTDNSGDIAQQYAEKYANIILINQENQGLSGARNTGIKHAKGDYIQFVDSDDYLEDNVLGGLMTKVEKDDLDVLRFKYQNVRINKESKEYEVFKPYKSDSFLFDDYSSEVTDGVTFLNERFGTACYAWAFILKRDVLNNCIFKPGIYFEDTEWTPRMLLRTKRVASVDTIVYNYLWREGSITLSQNDIQKQRKQLSDKMGLLQKLNQWGNNMSDRRWFDSMISTLIVNIVGMLASTFYAEREEYVRQIKAMQLLPLSTYHIALRTKRKVKLINWSIDVATIILHLKGKL